MDCSTDAREISKLGPDSSSTVRLDGTSWFPTTLSPTTGNDVQWFIYGRCAFEAIAEAIATAKRSDHRVYLLAWHADVFTNLRINETWQVGQALKAADDRGVPIRALVWKNLDPHYNTEPFVSFINSLRFGAALQDSRLPPLLGFGVHHQKALVVYGADGLIAFLGGMDLDKDRVESANDGQPLHDVHLRIVGPAATEVVRVFHERWRDHPDTPGLDQKGGVATFPIGLPIARPRPGNRHQLVRIGRTYPNAAKHGMTNAQGQPASYSFAPQGEMTAWQLIERGIVAARHFIYLEDQYLFSRRASTALAARIRESPQLQLVILTCASGQILEEAPQAVPRRRAFIADLRQADPKGSRWSLHCLRSQQDPALRSWSGTYIHSKTWIFDDLFTVTGSANANERGYSHDSEIVAAVADDLSITRGSQRSFAQQLRIALWHKHLGVAHRLLLDWQNGIRLWRQPPSGAMVTPFDLGEADPNHWNTSDPQYDLLWNIAFDPVGT